MNRPRLIRWLRFAVSAVCLLALVGLIVLWARSYWWRESLWGWLPTPGYLQVTSEYGGMMIIVTTEHSPSRWSISSKQAFPLYRYWEIALQNNGVWRGVTIFVPHWFLLLLYAALAFVPWLPWSTRYSLRTLLIVTTLVAAVLGLIVWMAK